MELVLRTVRSFLDSAGWTLEFDGRKTSIPREPQPAIVSRAYVKAHSADVFLGDHYEAVIALAPEQVGPHTIARGGTLKLYFDGQGRFISEDRFPPAAPSRVGR